MIPPAQTVILPHLLLWTEHCLATEEVAIHRSSIKNSRATLGNSFYSSRHCNLIGYSATVSIGTGFKPIFSRPNTAAADPSLRPTQRFPDTIETRPTLTTRCSKYTIRQDIGINSIEQNIKWGSWGRETHISEDLPPRWNNCRVDIDVAKSITELDFVHNLKNTYLLVLTNIDIPDTLLPRRIFTLNRLIITRLRPRLAIEHDSEQAHSQPQEKRSTRGTFLTLFHTVILLKFR